MPIDSHYYIYNKNCTLPVYGVHTLGPTSTEVDIYFLQMRKQNKVELQSPRCLTRNESADFNVCMKVCGGNKQNIGL
jgi:hypothetical protein